MYLASKNVYVTPVGKNRVEEKGSNRGKILSESTLTALIRHLVDVDGFVIRCNSVGTEGDIEVQFMLMGYFFDITLPKSALSISNNIYAGIRIENGEIAGQDDGGSYNGLSLGLQESDMSTCSASLKILSRKDLESAWSVPAESLVKFDLNRTRIDCIDGLRSVL